MKTFPTSVCGIGSGITAFLLFLTVLTVPLVCISGPEGSAENLGLVPVSIDVREELHPPLAASLRVYITVATNQYAFLVPKDYHVEKVDKHEITMATKDYTRFLSFSVLLKPGSESKESSLGEFCIDIVNSSKQNSKLSGQREIVADGLKGVALDVVWTGATGLPRKCRTAFIPRNEGILQIRADALEDEFESVQSDLNVVFNTFVHGAPGKLDVAPLAIRY